MSKKKFSELSRTAQVAAVITATAEVALLVAALRDISKRTPDQINGRKGLWVPACFINFIGPLSYFIWGRKKIEQQS